MSLIEKDRSKTWPVDLTMIRYWVVAYLALFSLFFVPLKLLGWWAFALPPWLLLVPLGLAAESIGSTFGISDEASLLIPPVLSLLISIGLGAAGFVRKSSSLVMISGFVFVPIPAILTAYLAATMLGEGIPTSS